MILDLLSMNQDLESLFIHQRFGKYGAKTKD
jgi:hypothetical protein